MDAKTAMTVPLARTLVAGVAAWIAVVVAQALTFGLIGFGSGGDGILLNPAYQSPKLIAVWTQLEPLPLLTTNPPAFFGGLLGLTVIHAFVYRWIRPVWPAGIKARAVRMAALLWLVMALFFEFFTPFNLFGEPVPLVILQLTFWVVVLLVEAFVLALVIEWKR